MARKLTLKQSAFCRAWVGNAGNGTQSYKDSYNSDATDSVAAAYASELLRNPKVKVEIQSLLDSNPLVLTDFDAVLLLTRLAVGTEIRRDEPPNHADSLKAIDQLSKIRGAYVTKLEHSGQLDTEITYDLSFSKRDDEEA